MDVIRWSVSQLTSYALRDWLIFVAIAFAWAYALRKPGIVLGHILVAIVVVVLDVRWIQGEMAKPGWDGQPDQDFVFMGGVIVRIVLINTVLLVVSILALRMRRTRNAARRSRATVAERAP